MSIATKRGDQGQTGLAGGIRISKADLRVESYGTVDELNTVLGFARSICKDEQIAQWSQEIQKTLFRVGSALATPPESKKKPPVITSEDVEILTQRVYQIEATEGILSDWSLPGAHPESAAFEMARTVCRRAERAAVRLHETGAEIQPEVLAYLNRLSDLLWLFGRLIEQKAGVDARLRDENKTDPSGREPGDACRTLLRKRTRRRLPRHRRTSGCAPRLSAPAPPDDTLMRILGAAHRAPSVGLMQPWRFIVIRDRAVREAVHANFLRANQAAQQVYEGERGEQYSALKLEGILEAPQNICVVCDSESAQGHRLGRHTMRETAVYSAVCAVQNLWLAARAEGVGVGWVSILDPDLLQQTLHIPDGITPVAYLCIGYVDRFAPEPELERSGWERRAPLESVLRSERYDASWKPGEQT